MAMLDEIGAYLETQGVGVVKTPSNAPVWPIYMGGFASAETDEVIMLAEGPGDPPIDEMGSTVGSVVALVCSLVAQARSLKYTTAYAKAEAIRLKLHKLGNVQLGGTRYLYVQARHNVAPLGRDDKGRWVMGLNFEVTKEASA